jgi:hypothetical protein
VPGVLITLERFGPGSPVPVGSVLSDERGEYAVRAPGPGRYRLDVKRIGVRRYASDSFDLAEGETRRVEVVLDALLYTLPEVHVAASVVCAARRNQVERVSALWDEAYAALTATTISARDRLVRGRVARYALTTDPENVATLREYRSEMEDVVERPFRSLNADSLSAVGYWRDLPGDSAEYYGPDAEVLLSDAFRRDHCYTAIEGGRDRRGLVGLAFEPVADRKLPDVRGTFWLDARTFDLRFVEFQYTRLPYGENSDRVGGEVHFARLPNGAWIVRRWFIRMPQYRRNRSAPEILRAALDSLSSIYRLVEEGGSVTVDGIHTFVRPASVSGVVLDSAGKPLADAMVRLAGTPFLATVDNTGRFRFDSVPPGNYSIAAEHEGYAVLGMLAAHNYVSLTEGVSTHTSLRAIRGRQVVSRLCGGELPVPRRATLRVILVDSATSRPFPDITFRVSWVEPSGAGRGLIWKEQRQSKTTDFTGAANFCKLPAKVPIELSIERPDREPLRVSVFELSQNELSARLVYARAP